MPMISLLRHAKSDWAQGSASDHDRVLAPRGIEAAPRMGRHIASSGDIPDMVLCSTALRARQTLELVLPELQRAPQVEYIKDLYHAGPDAILKALRALPSSCRHVMVVGHNPGFQNLAIKLCERKGRAMARERIGKYPSAALALYQFDGNWRELAEGSATLQDFVTPRGIAGVTPARRT